METETKKKVKQIVVNVTAEAKAKITSLKETLNVSDKEFVDAVLVVIGNTDEATLKAAVESVTIEKQKAKIAAKIAKIEAKLAEAQAELPTEDVVYTSEDESAE